MIQCPLCNKNDQMIYLDGEYDHLHGITCDIDELYCKRCERIYPLCTKCNEYECKYDLEDIIHTKHDLQVLYFIGFSGILTSDHKVIIHPNGDVSEDNFFDSNTEHINDPNNHEPIPTEFTSKAIGKYIQYFVNPQPGFSEQYTSCSWDMIDVTGPDGGYPTYWWCPQCNTVQEYSDK